MIAYLILVHRYAGQFKRLFKAIYHKDNHYLIHIDQKSDLEFSKEIDDFLMDYPNATLLESEKAVWGGYSLVNIELRGIKKLLNLNKDWKFFINLSGQDFPLQTPEYINAYLNQHEGTDFMKLLDQNKVRPETLNRIEQYFTDTGDDVTLKPKKVRLYLTGVTPYIGNQWMILSRKFCEFVTYSPEVERFKKFYQNTLIADEGFFQTVIMNTSYQSNIINDDMREIDWIPMGEIKLRPRDYTFLDAFQLTNNKNLFARKFDETIDVKILTILEKHLLAKKSSVAIQ